MATQIKIHRGNQIGGCITEIRTERTCILIDFGEELPGSRNEGPFVFPWEDRKVDAVLFTHYHGDHIGRFAEVPEKAQLYMSTLSREVLANIHGYLADHLPKLANFRQEKADQLRREAKKHREAINILNSGRVHTFRPQEREKIHIGDITITPVWVDHSAADACMFLIETPDKRILHTGDFRGHGIQGEHGKAMCGAVSRMREERAIDVLITEGTMMSRQNEKLYSEEALFQDADQLFEHHKHIFLIVSSTNLDSLQTFYQAAAKWKRLPIYVYNGYVKSQLETLGRYASENWGMPAMKDVEQIRAQSRLKEGCVAIIKANSQGMKLIERCIDCHPVVVYSMWQGYYYRNLDKALCEFVEACKEKSIPVYPLTDTAYGALHTSGHAGPELITEVIKAADPREIRPIHTEDAGAFLQLDITDEMKKRVDLGGYQPEKDQRALSDAALKKFLPGGTHRTFIELVQEYHDELAFCFRGNSGDSAVIYYKNHAVFHITKLGYVKFNFDHARYMDDWSVERDWLEKKGFSFENKKEPKKKERKRKNGKISVSYSIGEVSMPMKTAEALSFDELKKIYLRIRGIIDSFFAANDKKDHAFDRFRAEFSEDGEMRGTDRELTEKVVQQKLFLACHTLESGYFIYDLEFSQPYGKLLGCTNQPDMLAIRFDGERRPERLVFVEVKSKTETLEGSSGLREHIRGMEHYWDWLLPIRRRDACHILNQYIQLGWMKERDRLFKETEFEDLPKEILLIFTGQDTIDVLRKGSGEAKARSLLDMGYNPLYNFPEITLDGEPLPMEVYGKDFTLKGEPVRSEP